MRRTTITDADLVTRCRAGEAEAFGEIVDRYAPLVRSVSFGTLGGAYALSEDVSQEAFVAAWSQLHSLREPKHLGAWLCGIARNLGRRAREKHRRSVAPPDDAPLNTEPATPLDEVLAAERNALLHESLRDLPPDYRDVLIAYYREGCSTRSLSELLDISEPAVHKRLSRARSMLRKGVRERVENALQAAPPRRDLRASVLAALAGIVRPPVTTPDASSKAIASPVQEGTTTMTRTGSTKLVAASAAASAALVGVLVSMNTADDTSSLRQRNIQADVEFVTGTEYASDKVSPQANTPAISPARALAEKTENAERGAPPLTAVDGVNLVMRVDDSRNGVSDAALAAVQACLRDSLPPGGLAAGFEMPFVVLDEGSVELPAGAQLAWADCLSAALERDDSLAPGMHTVSFSFEPQSEPTPTRPTWARIAAGPAFSEGPPTAPITLMHFVDFHCPYSARNLATLDALRDEYGDKIRFVTKLYPLREETEMAAHAALAAGAQGEFWAMHDLMFGSQDQLGNRDELVQLASRLALDVERFTHDLDERVHVAQLERDQQHAADLGVTVTPTLFVGGHRVAGARSLEDVRSLIEAELAGRELAANE